MKTCMTQRESYTFSANSARQLYFRHICSKNYTLIAYTRLIFRAYAFQPSLRINAPSRSFI